MPNENKLSYGEWLSTLSEEHLECRAMGHSWKPLNAQYIHETKICQVVHVCQRCVAERHAFWTREGEVLSTNYKYPSGYEMKGSAVEKPKENTKDYMRSAYVSFLFSSVDNKGGTAKEASAPE